ncbi:unnamed protein product [Spirodela intermedia]|uniref:Uncharacterized protein n=2 Tax=Spirodela intermedia TaxID=51605 RepID=A0A7I8ITP0_SPIIN|nr:unnamed protein product [Spirodela intermedia]CAA6661384.1 unnamed protein product [Spirodela intermedia]CAA7397746.1 unnamed protein product [Spirodela intermedia]
MIPQISCDFFFLSTVKDLWETVHTKFSEKNNEAHIYELETKSMSMMQGSKTMMEYAGELKNLWVELDYYLSLDTEKRAEITAIRNFIDRRRVFKFLAGLNFMFDQVSQYILNREKKVELDEAISIILNEDSRRNLMMSGPEIDNSAFMIKQGDNMKKTVDPSKPFQQSQRRNQKTDSRDNLWCMYCRKSRHT